MIPILAAGAQPTIERLARLRALLAFDFDGTLAPIVADRQAARIQPGTRRLLRALAFLYPCAVISGRARADVARRLEGIPLVGIVGNHGAEAGRGPLDRTRRARVLEWIRVLETGLRSEAGVEIEDKRFSVAVHYRRAPSRAAARRLVVRLTSELAGARVFGGHAVVNVVPADAPSKATALEHLADSIAAAAVLYLGDDRTDEDVFRSPRVDVAVRVGRTARTAARWYVPGQSAVDALLRALITGRTRLDGLGECCDALARAVGE
jgi:trehalose 6-phosphate phosphatase